MILLKALSKKGDGDHETDRGGIHCQSVYWMQLHVPDAGGRNSL